MSSWYNTILFCSYREFIFLIWKHGINIFTKFSVQSLLLYQCDFLYDFLSSFEDLPSQLLYAILKIVRKQAVVASESGPIAMFVITTSVSAFNLFSVSLSAFSIGWRKHHQSCFSWGIWNLHKLRGFFHRFHKLYASTICARIFLSRNQRLPRWLDGSLAQWQRLQWGQGSVLVTFIL